MKKSTTFKKLGISCPVKKIVGFLMLFAYCQICHAQKKDSTRQAHIKLNRSLLYNKGNFFIGTSFGTSTRNTEDWDLQFFAIESLDIRRSNIRLESGYFIKNNWALGVLTRYGRARSDMDFLSVDGVATAFQSASERYSIFLTSKNFIPLGNNSRFITFVNSSMGGTWRNQVSETLSNGILQRSFSESKQLELVFQPGISFNVAKGFNVELAIEFASIGGEWSQSYLNGEPTKSSNRFRGNFSFNILRTDFGLFYYFNTQNKGRKHEK